MATTVTVKPADEKEQEDIFKIGNLVQSRDRIILVTESEDKTFSGVVLDTKDSQFEYYDTWDKKHFQKFTGTVTLQST